MNANLLTLAHSVQLLQSRRRSCSRRRHFCSLALANLAAAAACKMLAGDFLQWRRRISIVAVLWSWPPLPAARLNDGEIFLTGARLSWCRLRLRRWPFGSGSSSALACETGASLLLPPPLPAVARATAAGAIRQIQARAQVVAAAAAICHCAGWRRRIKVVHLKSLGISLKIGSQCFAWLEVVMFWLLPSNCCCRIIAGGGRKLFAQIHISEVMASSELEAGSFCCRVKNLAQLFRPKRAEQTPRCGRNQIIELSASTTIEMSTC